MPVTFPLSPVPAWYTNITFADDRNGVFYIPSPTIVATLSQSGADAYEVRDYQGAVISSGSVSGTTVTPTAPGGGWLPGWYRLYLTGPNSNALFGDSYGASNFCVFRDNPRFSHSPVLALPVGTSLEEFTTKAVLGFGTSRLTISDVTVVDPDNPGTSDLAKVRDNITKFTDLQSTDIIRGHPLVCVFPNGTVDLITVPGVSGTGEFLHVYPKDGTIDPQQLYIESAAGSVSGSKILIYYPDSVTLVETYDNLPDDLQAAQAINATSAYVFAQQAGGIPAVASGPTTTLTTFRDGVIATVGDLYPRGVHYFEGPSNEPEMVASAARKMAIFKQSVQMGHASAIATGPCPVSISDWDEFLAAGGADACDEFSFHPYNAITNGDFNLGRSTIEAWQNLLEVYSAADKLRWNTEPTHVFSSVYGVYHPRRSRVPVIEMLLWEQYGVPRERNIVWYDYSGGFWAYAAFIANEDGSLNPYGALLRMLAEESFGKLYDHRIDFGSAQANAIFLGSVYRGSDDSSCAVVMSQSSLPGATITFTVTGSTAPIGVVDGFGNLSYEAQSSGRITADVSDVPIYLRLGVGVHLSVYSVNDWGSAPPPSISVAGVGTMSTVAAPAISDSSWETDYASGAGTQMGTTLPDSAEILFNSSVDVDRVIIWCGQSWQTRSTLIEFEIQTTANGVDWTTRKTVTRSGNTSFLHGTSANNAGCQRETFWDEQWIFDETLPATYTCKGVRVYATDASYGGEPDSNCITTGGQGAATKYLTIQEIAVPSASTPAFFHGSYPSVVLGTSGLVGYWRLGEASDAVPGVSEVNSPTLDGTYTVGGVILGLPGALVDVNTGFQAGGFNYQLIVPHDALLDVANVFTFEFWANGVRTYLDQTVCGRGGNFDGHPTAAAVHFHNGLLKLAQDHGAGEVVVNVSATAATTGWHHFAVTKNGATTKLYMDGVDITGTGTDATFTNLTSPLYIGGTDAGYVNTYGLQLDEVSYYNVALSAATVLEHFEAGGTPVSAPGNVVAPFIEGTSVSVSGQISCVHGQWSVKPTAYSYQWQDSANGATGWANLAGQTRSVLIIHPAQRARYLRCNVFAQNVVGPSSAIPSNTVGPVVDSINRELIGMISI